MEKLVAVYRVVNTKTGAKKYGTTWIKSQDQAVARSRSSAEATERLDAVWWIDWKDPTAKYNLVHGIHALDGGGPTVDMAAQMRIFHLKPKGEKKPRWRRKNNHWESTEHRNVVGLVRALLESNAKKPSYTPPFVVYEAPERA